MSKVPKKYNENVKGYTKRDGTRVSGYNRTNIHHVGQSYKGYDEAEKKFIDIPETNMTDEEKGLVEYSGGEHSWVAEYDYDDEKIVEKIKNILSKESYKEERQTAGYTWGDNYDILVNGREVEIMMNHDRDGFVQIYSNDKSYIYYLMKKVEDFDRIIEFEVP